jgi:thiopurine S-methyltransferase
MNPEFWHERWEKGEIGFHQHDFNRHMQEFLGRLGVQAGAHILVPLCGKSLDMLWLADHGYRVTGIEISELAARDFFVENGLDHEIIDCSGVPVYRGQNIDIWCADIFTVEKTDLPLIDAVYDRAALIALPPDMRLAYADHLTNLINPGIRSLLVTLDYPQQEMRGPPFSVTPAEVEQLFSAQYRINRLHSEDCLVNEPRFRKKGLTRLDEHVFILQKNAGHL